MQPNTVSKSRLLEKEIRDIREVPAPEVLLPASLNTLRWLTPGIGCADTCLGAGRLFVSFSLLIYGKIWDDGKTSDEEAPEETNELEEGLKETNELGEKQNKIVKNDG